MSKQSKTFNLQHLISGLTAEERTQLGAQLKLSHPDIVNPTHPRRQFNKPWIPRAKRVKVEPTAPIFDGPAVWSEGELVVPKPIPALYYCGKCQNPTGHRGRRMQSMEELTIHCNTGHPHYPFFGEWKSELEPSFLEALPFSSSQLQSALAELSALGWEDLQA